MTSGLEEGKEWRRRSITLLINLLRRLICMAKSNLLELTSKSDQEILNNFNKDLFYVSHLHRQPIFAQHQHQYWPPMGHWRMPIKIVNFYGYCYCTRRIYIKLPSLLRMESERTRHWCLWSRGRRHWLLWIIRGREGGRRRQLPLNHWVC